MSRRVVIVDDEPLARERIERALERHARYEVVGQAEDAAAAARLIEREDPDIVFMDLRMPGGDGLSVIADMAPDQRPLVVFVTAYDDRAVDAFRVHAVDYLVKPFDTERFDEAMDEVDRRFDDGDATGRLEALIRDLRPASRHAGRLRIKEDERVFFVPVEEVHYLESDGNHVVLHMQKGTEHRIRTTLTGLLDELDPARFVRVHRSTVLNIDHLKEVQPWFSGDYLALLKDGRELRVSRRYRDELMRPTF